VNIKHHSSSRDSYEKMVSEPNSVSMDSSSTSCSMYYIEMKHKSIEEIQNAKNKISSISRLFGSMRMHDVNIFNKVYK
jgi:hypothetical protein